MYAIRLALPTDPHDRPANGKPRHAYVGGTADEPRIVTIAAEALMFEDHDQAVDAVAGMLDDGKGLWPAVVPEVVELWREKKGAKPL